MTAGNTVFCLGILGIALAIAASVWYPMQRLTEQLNNIVTGGGHDTRKPRDCFDIQDRGSVISGLYRVYPGNMRKGFEVYCDMETDSGGWLVFQQRQDDTVNFKQDWKAYQFGFGNESEFWLGNEYLHLITKQGWYELYVEMEDFEGDTKYAKYSLFHVDHRDNEFRLTVGGYSGNAGDSFSSHSGHKFSTIDKDNDPAPGSCANTFKGGWWYTNCLTACLNGQYLKGEHESKADGINWYHYKGYNYSLKRTRMMIRPA